MEILTCPVETVFTSPYTRGNQLCLHLYLIFLIYRCSYSLHSSNIFLVPPLINELRKISNVFLLYQSFDFNCILKIIFKWVFSSVILEPS
jgi:hypothetical protein